MSTFSPVCVNQPFRVRTASFNQTNKHNVHICSDKGQSVTSALSVLCLALVLTLTPRRAPNTIDLTQQRGNLGM